MREKFFYWIVRRYYDEGCVMPPWAVVLRWALLPLDTLFWSMRQHRGYQFMEDIWLIEGVRYSAPALRMLANAQGELYRITRTGDVITLQRLSR